MEKNPTWTCVVALALHDGAGRWLMHRRPAHKQHGGLWEFPGGKVETGENPWDALVREIHEETGLMLQAEALKPVAFAEERLTAGSKPIVIMLYTCAWSGGAPEPLEGGELAWFARDEIGKLDKPPLDVALAARLFEKLPE